jgi:hypothetical protein
MSRPNKVNKTNYDQGGRLTPDEMARERQKQARLGGHPVHDRIKTRAQRAGRRRGEEGATRPRSAPEE